MRTLFAPKIRPTTAYIKRPGDGIVRADIDKRVGWLLRPVLLLTARAALNEQTGQMSKCDMCVGFPTGESATASPVLRPVRWRPSSLGPIDELRAKYGSVCDVNGLPGFIHNQTYLVVKAHQGAEKRVKRYA